MQEIAVVIELACLAIVHVKKAKKSRRVSSNTNSLQWRTVGYMVGPDMMIWIFTVLAFKHTSIFR